LLPATPPLFVSGRIFGVLNTYESDRMELSLLDIRRYSPAPHFASTAAGA